jgi:hypothetical protein
MFEAPPTPQSAFIAHAAQQASYTPGYNRSAMGGIPQLGLANMVMQPMMASMMAQFGMFPGQFSPDVNVADLMRAEQYRVEGMRRAAVAAQQTDVDTWISQQSGLMRAIDAPFGLEQQAAFRRTYRAAAPMLSMLGQVAPEIVDSLHGSRGSAALMTSGIMRGGQYQFDALAPGMGISGATADQMQRTIAESLYGTPEATSRMLGVGMGQLGQIYDESARRGLLPGSISTRSRAEQLRQLSGFTGMSQDQLTALDADQMGQQLTKFDTTRTATRLGELARSVSAMRELFGSQGQPNAPMATLMNALEQITQGRLANMPAAQVEQLVRRTKNVLETTGVSLDALTGLTAQGNEFGKSLGLDPTLAVQSAARAVTFGSSYKNTFGSDYQAFGAMGADEVTAYDNRLRQRAAGSEQAQFGGAVIRAAQLLKIKGGPDDKGGTEFGRLAEALMRGDDEFNGVSMYEMLRRDKLMPLMAASGATAAETDAFNKILSDKFGNQEYIEKYELGAMVRRQQPREIVNTIGRAAGENAVSSALLASGVSVEESRELARRAGPALMRALLETDDIAGLSTIEGRADIMKAALARELGDERAAQIGNAVALSFEASGNEQARRAGYNDLGKLVQTNNATTLRNELRVTRTARANADIDQMLAPLGKAGPIQRIMDMLADSTKLGDAEITKVLGTAAGGIDVGQVRAIFNQQKKLRELRSKDALTPEETAEAAAAEQAILGSVSGIVESAKKSGADVGRRIDNEALDKASDVSATAVADALKSKKIPAVTSALDKQLTRSGNLVQELYTDDQSLRRMGAGGFELAQQAEQQRLQLLRATDGNVELLAKALADDPSIPEAERKKIQATHKALGKSMRDIRDRISGGKGMDDAAWAKELETVKKFRAAREADDVVQQRTLVDQLAASAGMDPTTLSAEDRAKLTPLLGGVDDRRRLDVSSAIAARAKLAAAAKERKTTIASLRGDKNLADEFAQAGALVELSTDGKADELDLETSLKSLGPSVKSEAARGAGERGALELTGTLTVVDGSGTITGTGYSSR